MAFQSTFITTFKQILAISAKYFIPATLLFNRLLQANGVTAQSSINMTELVQHNDIYVGLATPSMAYFINHSEIFYNPNQSFAHDFALNRYLLDSKNTYDYLVSTDTSTIIAAPIPKFFSNENAFCQIDSVALIKDPDTCINIDAQKLNQLYQNARAFGREKQMMAAINIYNDMLKIIPGDNPYFNPLFKQIYWHLGSSHFLLRNLDQAKRCFELAIALATDNKNLGMIYSKLGLIFNMQGDNHKALIAHQKAVKLIPENELALTALKETEKRLSRQNQNENLIPIQRI